MPPMTKSKNRNMTMTQTLQDSFTVKIKYLRPQAKETELLFATAGSAGLDLAACIEEKELLFTPDERIFIGTGIAMEITQQGFAGFVYSRSGLGTKQGLVVTQGVGVIDPDYRGEIMVSLHNISGQPQRITKGQRIAQLVFMPFARPKIVSARELTATQRGSGGFGSTG